MVRHRALIVLAAVVLLMALGCRNEDNSVPDVEQQDRIIATADSTDDPSMLRITWFPAPCETFDSVQVELDDNYANLLVRVNVDIDDCPPAGSVETLVDLGEPIGDRQVWDRAVNDTVAVDAG